MASKKTSSTKPKKSSRKEIDVPDISREPGTPMLAEVLLWIVLAICVILMLSNIFGIGGMIGNTISRFFFGVFGVSSYAVPFVLFFFTAFLVANHGNTEAWIKGGAAFIMFMIVCAFCELLSGQYDAERVFSDYYEMGSDFHSGGGVAGALLCRIFFPVFGNAGTWICLLVLLIICAIIITERSLFDNIRGRGKRAYCRAKSGSMAKRELHSLKKERNQLQKRQRMQKQIQQLRDNNEELKLEVQKPRRERIVSGVMENTDMDRTLPPAQEIHEVVPRIRRKNDADRQEETDRRENRKQIKQTDKMEEVESAPVKKISDSRARKMVDSVDTEKKARQMDLNFTIQRDGVSETVEEKSFASMNLESDTKTIDNIQKDDTQADNIPQNKSVKNPKSSKEEQEKNMKQVADEIAQADCVAKPAYVFPPLSLLSKPSRGRGGDSMEEVKQTAVKLQQTLHNFGVNVTVTNVSCGPAVTRYEIMPEQGVKVSRIVNLSDDIKLNLAAADIRIEAPIPGKPAVGIEVPNKENSAVHLRELLESDEFKKAPSNLSFAVGKDIAGKVVVADIAKMPHLLIAGATGSGKSVCINTLIMSILYKADPEDVKLIMIDPKVVELSVYNGIPHLFIPVVTDPKKASGALNWGVAEMTDRYNKFAECGVRDLKGYNARIAAMTDIPEEERPKKLPQIIIIVDELADLMMVAPGEVEDSICRLAQLARAAGIHLVIATQRPSVNVITGLIKANMPSRIAFSVTSGVDSRTIIDMNGAEKLLGKGDMLFYPQGYQKPARVQGAFVSDKEVSDVTEFLTKKNDTGAYKQEMEERMNLVQQATSAAVETGGGGGSEYDAYFADAGKFIIEKEKASIGMLQRVFKIGFNRAARIMDQLSEAGVVGPEEGTKPRKVLMSMEEFEQYIDEYI
ncbi:MAG: DNA translocase FtsK [Eubacteriales bacterium]|nr:DNA translocase FtsK [Eubacteriales bacterium]